MWEWSKQLIKKKAEKKLSTSLLAAYDDLFNPELTPYSERIKNLAIAETPPTKVETIEVFDMRKIVEQKIQELGLDNMTVIERAYDPQSWQEMSSYFDEYQRVRAYFFKLIGYSNAKTCMNAGMNKNDIACLKEGIAPENFNIHLKIPFDFGGNLDFKNFSLVKTHPLHDNIHKIIDLQIENNFLRIHRKIFLPYFEGKIYYD